MPSFRNVPSRRSRRISHQEPTDEVWQTLDLSLAYPSKAELYVPPAPPPSPSSTSCPESIPELASPKFTPRISHARKRQPGHIPRPPNAFMVFRSEFCERQKKLESPERDHRNVSRIAGLRWQALPDDQRVPYFTLAKSRAKEHARLYPGYKYRPGSKTEKPAKRRVRHNPQEEIAKCKMAAKLPWPRIRGRELESAQQMIAGDNLSPSPSTTPTLLIKEGNFTPDLSPDRSASPVDGFVLTADIPPFELNPAGLSDIKEECKDIVRLLPPKYDPSFAEPHFGIKPEAYEFASSHLLSMSAREFVSPDDIFSIPALERSSPDTFYNASFTTSPFKFIPPPVEDGQCPFIFDINFPDMEDSVMFKFTDFTLHA